MFRLNPQFIKVLLSGVILLFCVSFSDANAQSPTTTSSVDSSGDPRLGTESQVCIPCLSKGNPDYGNNWDKLLQTSTDLISPYLKEIENSPAVKSIAKAAKSLKASFSSLKDPFHCWHKVKDFLVKARAVKYGELPTRFARDAGEDLKKSGFVDLMAKGQPLAGLKNPCLAPAGSVLVYDGGSSSAVDHKTGKRHPTCGGIPCGHVEIKVGEVGVSDFASDYRSGHPVTGSCTSEGNSFKLKAILVPGSALVPFAQ